MAQMPHPHNGHGIMKTIPHAAVLHQQSQGQGTSSIWEWTLRIPKWESESQSTKY